MARATTPSRVVTVDAHVAGAPLRLVVAGAPAPRGVSFAARVRSLERDADALRRLIMHEPRGHRAMVGALLVEPGPQAHAGVVFMDGDGWVPICGHGLIAVLTIAIERGLITLVDAGAGASRAGDMGPPSAQCGRIETLAGILEVEWTLAPPPAQKVLAVTYRGPSASVVESALPLVTGPRIVRADVVDFTGRHLVVDSEAAGVALDLAAEANLVRAARLLAEGYEATSLARSSGVALDAVVFVGPPRGDDADVRCGAVHEGTGLDRGPSGGATGALCALLDAMGALDASRAVTIEGPGGSRLRATVARRCTQEGRPAIVPAISGEAAITGDHVFYADDPAK